MIQTVPTHDVDLKNYQKLLIPYSYNILGVIEDAEDVVQEVLMKWLQIDKEKIDNAKAYLIKSVVNKSINLKKQQVTRRKNYHGIWLPQPVVTSSERSADKYNILSYSVLVMMEVLKAKERAVFMLKEVFDYEHSEIAEVLEITTESSRQIFKRAKDKLEQRGAITLKKGGENENIARIIKAVSSGDLKELEQILFDDVKFASDGGGKVSAASNYVFGKKDVIKLLAGLVKKFLKEYQYSISEVNGDPAVLYYSDGMLKLCQVICIKDDKVESVYNVLNPDKLKNL
jgi:RNA polymerase sigma factor (sigma-70 family)